MAAHGALRAGDGSYSSSSRHGRGVALGIFSHALPLWEPYEPLNGRNQGRRTLHRSTQPFLTSRPEYRELQTVGFE